MNTKVQFKCALCPEIATTREHLIKKTIVDELMFDKPISKRPLKILRPRSCKIVQGSKSDAIKYPPNLCQSCNGHRSQPFDRAYHLFMNYVISNEKNIFSSNRINLNVIKGLNKEHLFKYFIKSFCCMIDSTQHTKEKTLFSPLELVNAFHGGSYGKNLLIQFISRGSLKEHPMRKYILVSNPIYTQLPGNSFSFMYSESFGWFQIRYIYHKFHNKAEIRACLPFFPNYWVGKSKEILVNTI
ncbi:hypothetical protein BN59_00389 [Legionella massiliensis]|uniref:Uncharacterized protein n=1 Tax=Legionella massiliensis TaxID=1034943 RepID=A0A078KWN0_9GAMM|nr:hypothetical protein [Legionella massiliensis]CDZ76123.1 hypothetical protein BN59_00389 [Legionella massiliensis]CEE11861.1 hypothetical protein BN1094_00389 [Legionella massiliensis]